MVVESKNAAPWFTVEGNVYKGPVEPYQGTYKSVGELIWKKVTSHGDKIAQLDALTDKVITYSELQNKIVKCALWLREEGIRSGDVISLCTHNHVDCVVPCLAAAYINAIFNPWDYDMNPQTTVHILNLTSPKIIFCNEKCAGSVLKAMEQESCRPKMVVFGNVPRVTSFADILSKYSDSEVASFTYDELDDVKKTACILHSSGTTGMPKGVELSNYCLLLNNETKAFDMSESVPLWYSPLYWISGVLMNLRSISVGIEMIIYPEFDEEMTCVLIDKYKVSWLFLSTSMTNRFVRAGHIKNYSLSSLQLIVVGGAILKMQMQEELRRSLPRTKIIQAYGMTEIGGIATCQLAHHKSGSCGTVARNSEMKVMDPEEKRVLGPNETGEVWVKSMTVMNGYYRNPEQTKDTLDEEGWMHTGDLGYIDDDGELFIVDRLKELIKYRGNQISPVEIETCLLSYPGVVEVAVVGVPHETDDELPLAYVTKKSGAEVTEQELIDHVANNMLDRYRLRGGVMFLEVFPYTRTGKIARKELKAMAREQCVDA